MPTTSQHQLIRKRRRRSIKIEWTRLWLPRGGTFVLDSDGYVAEPHSERFFSPINQHLRTLAQLDDVACLLLVGDPGLGKSHEVERYSEEIESRCQAADCNAALLAFNIPDFESRAEMESAIFRSATLSKWAEGDGLLFLVLDSLDESRIDFKTLCNFLLDQIEALPVERLRLRLTCRTSELPASFHDALKQIFIAAFERDSSDHLPIVERDPLLVALDQVQAEEAGGTLPNTKRAIVVEGGEPFQCVELAPLSRTCVKISALTQLGTELDAERFLQNVSEAGAQTFAARPFTLFELLSREKAQKSLAISQHELFVQMCTRLASLVGEKYKRASAELLSGPVERYSVARRITAAMLLGNKRSFSISDGMPLPDSELDLSDVHGKEEVNGAGMRITEKTVEYVINSGLFTAVGERGMQAHHTLAEFMTADWIAAHKLGIEQIESLLCDPIDPGRRVVPQLRQTAAWLATMRRDVFSMIIDRDPDILLWNDIVDVPVENRPQLVAALLGAVADNRLSNPPLGQMRQLRRLTHPGLTSLLVLTIRDRAAAAAAREMALDIAIACNATGAAEAAAELALHHDEPLDLRSVAAHLVGESGTEGQSAALAPLIFEYSKQDVSDQLKGAALYASWRQLPAEELFRALTPMRRSNFGGNYSAFLRMLANELPHSYLSAGAAWLADDVTRGNRFDDIARRIFWLAFTSTTELSEDVVQTLGSYISRQNEQYQSAYGSPMSWHHDTEPDLPTLLGENTTLRRRLVRAVVVSSRKSDAFFYLPECVPGLLRADDVDWALQELVSLDMHHAQRRIWVGLIKSIIEWDNLNHLESVFRVRTDTDAASVLGDLTQRFGSAHAAHEEMLRRRAEQVAAHSLREAARAAKEEERKRKERTEAAGPLEPRLREALEDAGDAGRAWEKACIEIHREGLNRSLHLSEKMIMNLRQLRKCDSASAIVAAARAYLQEAEVPPDPFPSPGRMKYAVAYAFTAMATVRLIDREAFEALDGVVFSRWMRIVVGKQCTTAEDPIRNAILQHASRVSPDEFSAELLASIMGREPGGMWPDDEVLRLGVASPTFLAAVYGVIRANSLAETDQEYLMKALLKNRAPGASEVAHEAFKTKRRSSRARSTSKNAAALLLTYSPRRYWDDLWRAIGKDAPKAREILQRAADTRHSLPETSLSELDDSQVADLQLRIAELYPPSEDVWHTGVYSPGARDNLQYWRQQLIRHLEGRRTESATIQLERIAQAHPESEWLARSCVEARAALRSDRWRGVSASELMQLATRNDLRFVESGADLVRLLQESLSRLQTDLQGELRTVVGLWNESVSGNDPKGEHHLANAIALHLRQDLAGRQIIIGRELILQVGILGAAAGLRTDIDVVAIGKKDPHRSIDRVRVVIEVKGSWNPTVNTALSAQLVHQYMKPHGIPNGLYVVGYYTCDSWKKGQKSARSKSLGSKEQLEATLEMQALQHSNALQRVRAVVLDTSLPSPGYVAP